MSDAPDDKDDATRLGPRTVVPGGAVPPPIPPAAAPAGTDIDYFGAGEPAAPSEATTIRPRPVVSTTGELQVGTRLSHTYEITAPLAKGGMAEVYRARHLAQGTEHVVKVLQRHLEGDERIVELFRREPLALRQVRHSAVVAYDGSFLDENGRPYIVMEFVDGPSLSDLLERHGPFTPADVRALRERIGRGLEAAHLVGIVHRDLSPDNIILPGERVEQAKIIDFGIARNTELAAHSVIGDDFAGKYSYVAPEQLGMHGGKVDPRADIYSLGLVLVAAAAGKPLDMGASPISVIEARRQVPDLASIPAELREELGWLLQPDPKDRPQSIADMIAAGGKPATGTPGRKNAARPVVTDRDARRGSALPLAAAAAVLLLAAGGGGWWFLMRDAATPVVIADPVTPPPLPTGGTAATPAQPPAATPPATPTQPRPSIADLLDPDRTAGAAGSGPVAAPVAPPVVAAPAPVPTPPPQRPVETQPTPPPVVPPRPADPPPQQQQPQPPQVASLPSAESIRPQVEGALRGYTCAKLDPLLSDGPRLTVEGFVSSDADRARLTSRLASLALAEPATLRIAVRPPPFCDVLNLIASAGVPGEALPGLTLSKASGQYRAGESLIVRATQPGVGEGFLTVDYFDNEGNVVHLLPIPSRPENRLRGGTTVTLGVEAARAKAGERFYTISPPFGPNMIVAVTSSAPLHRDLRPEMEKASDYLPVLRAALAQPGRRPAASTVFFSTGP